MQLYFVFDSFKCCLGTVGNLLGLQQSYCMTAIATPHTTYLKDNLIQQYRFHRYASQRSLATFVVLCTDKEMRWPLCWFIY